MEFVLEVVDEEVVHQWENSPLLWYKQANDVVFDTWKWCGVWYVKMMWCLIRENDVVFDTWKWCGVWYVTMMWCLKRNDDVVFDTWQWCGVWYLTMMGCLIRENDVVFETWQWCGVWYMKMMRCLIRDNDVVLDPPRYRRAPRGPSGNHIRTGTRSEIKPIPCTFVKQPPSQSSRNVNAYSLNCAS